LRIYLDLCEAWTTPAMFKAVQGERINKITGHMIAIDPD
jgi:hypothetical protein